MRRRVSVACGLVLCALTAEACGAPTPGGSAEPSRGCRAGTLPAADGVRGEVAGRSYLLDAPSGPADRPAPLIRGLVAGLLGCRLADRLAAVAPVAGAVDLGDCAPARPVPILLLYGGADRVVPPDVVRRGIDWWVQRNACGAVSSAGGCSRWAGCAADVVACEVAQGHRWPPGASEKIGRFFAAHPRP